jgi:hypothetical protein
MFPTELFSQLTVHKSSDAHTLEGGAAGTVNMRMARPFRQGRWPRLAYSIQGISTTASATARRQGIAAREQHLGSSSACWSAVAGYNNKVNTTGFETIGWTNANLQTPSATITRAKRMRPG